MRRRSLLRLLRNIVDEMSMAESCKESGPLMADCVRRIHILRLVVAFVKQSGGWNKSCPPDGGTYDVELDISKKDDYWIDKHLRIPREHILRVAIVMGVPTIVRTRNRDSCCQKLAFIMLLYKFSWPRRLIDFAQEFGGNGTRKTKFSHHLF